MVAGAGRKSKGQRSNKPRKRRRDSRETESGDRCQIQFHNTSSYSLLIGWNVPLIDLPRCIGVLGARIHLGCSVSDAGNALIDSALEGAVRNIAHLLNTLMQFECQSKGEAQFKNPDRPSAL